MRFDAELLKRYALSPNAWIIIFGIAYLMYSKYPELGWHVVAIPSAAISFLGLGIFILEVMNLIKFKRFGFKGWLSLVSLCVFIPPVVLISGSWLLPIYLLIGVVAIILLMFVFSKKS